MRTIYLLAFFLLSGTGLWAQKGDIWPTETRQEFEVNGNGDITKEGVEEAYRSFYLFINNNEFIHCTAGITSLYKILNRKEVRGGVEYSTISEAGNKYTMFFHKKDAYIVIAVPDRGYSIYIGCLAPYETKVFDDLNR